MDQAEWKIVTRKIKKQSACTTCGSPEPPDSDADDSHYSEKIEEPCWFYNNGGCKHKDGREKKADDCKYLHTYSQNVQRPPHLGNRKPCDKFNLDGYCKWNANCKYSHRILSPDEWIHFYPDVIYQDKNTVVPALKIQTELSTTGSIENSVNDLTARMKIFEYKQECMSKELQFLIGLFFKKSHFLEKK